VLPLQGKRDADAESISIAASELDGSPQGKAWATSILNLKGPG